MYQNLSNFQQLGSMVIYFSSSFLPSSKIFASTAVAAAEAEINIFQPLKHH